MPKNPGPEKLIQNAILEWLKWQPEAFFWQHNNNAVFDAKRGCFKSFGKWSMRGVSDIIGMWESRFLAIEVKAGKNSLTQDQRLFLLEIERRGGIAFVAKSLDEVIKRLKQKPTS
jgi:hypothetical protein